MEQSPFSEAKSESVCQEIPLLLWDSKARPTPHITFSNKLFFSPSPNLQAGGSPCLGWPRLLI